MATPFFSIKIKFKYTVYVFVYFTQPYCRQLSNCCFPNRFFYDFYYNCTLSTLNASKMSNEIEYVNRLRYDYAYKQTNKLMCK